MRNKFGTQLSCGNNLELLAKVARFFEERRKATIVRYYCGVETNSRNKKYLLPSDLHECEICGTKLYTQGKGVDNFLEDGSIETVTEKKHMVLVDARGGIYHTCYGINWCFNRIGYEVPEVKDEEREQIVPTFRQFLNVDIPHDGSREADLLGKLEDDVYARVVEPFLRKWMHSPINKQNLYKFLCDLSEVKSQFLPYFEGSAVGVFEDNLFRVLGIAK